MRPLNLTNLNIVYNTSSQMVIDGQSLCDSCQRSNRTVCTSPPSRSSLARGGHLSDGNRSTRVEFAHSNEKTNWHVHRVVLVQGTNTWRKFSDAKNYVLQSNHTRNRMSMYSFTPLMPVWMFQSLITLATFFIMLVTTALIRWSATLKQASMTVIKNESQVMRRLKSSSCWHCKLLIALSIGYWSRSWPAWPMWTVSISPDSFPS